MRFPSIPAILLAVASAVSAAGCAANAPADDFSETSADATVAGKVEVTQAADGSYFFRVRTGSGSILLTSNAYTSRLGAIGGLLSALDAGDTSGSYQVEQDTHGYLAELISSSGSVVATTKVYTTQSSAKRAATSAVHALSLYLDKRASATGARFEVNTDSSGQDYFVVYAANGEAVLTSESYSSTAAAYNGAYSLKDGVTYVVSQNVAGDWYFIVRASNNQTLATSESYPTASGARAGRDAVKSLLSSIKPF
jgi:hypothetical protein